MEMNSVQWNSSIPPGVDNLMTDNLLDDELVNSGIITPGTFFSCKLTMIFLNLFLIFFFFFYRSFQ